MEPRSPCSRPECLNKNKMLCLQSCPALKRYQEYLALTEDRYAPPAIDYTDDDRAGMDTDTELQTEFQSDPIFSEWQEPDY